MSALDPDRPSATVFAEATDIGQFRDHGLGPDDIPRLDEIQRRLAQSAYACLNPLQADWRTARWLDAGLASRVWDHVCRFAAPERLETVQDHYARLWLDAYRAGAPCDWPVEVIHAYADAVTQWLLRLTIPGSDPWVGVRTLHRLVGYHSRIISVALSRYEKTRSTEHLLLDPVTGLPNRVAFIEDLNRWTSRGGIELAVIAMDLQDVVGPVSDRDDQWHSLLVRQIAQRCRDVLRDQDLVARIGWNEFAFLLPAIKGEGHALLACERISRTLRESFRVDGLRTLVRPTLGVGLFPRHAQEAEPLLRMAELARNEAAAHKRPIVVYSESLGHTLRERRAVEREFETALQDNAVLVYFAAPGRAGHRTSHGRRGAGALAQSPGRAGPAERYPGGLRKRGSQLVALDLYDQHRAATLRGLGPSGLGPGRECQPDRLRSRRAGAAGLRQPGARALGCTGPQAHARDHRGLFDPGPRPDHDARWPLSRRSRSASRSTTSVPDIPRWPTSNACPSTSSRSIAGS